MNGFLDSPEIQADLRDACEMVFSRYGYLQSTYPNSEELAQQVSLRVIEKDWYSHFRGEAAWRSAFYGIAHNLLIDEFRKDKAAKRRRDLAVSLDQPGWDSLVGTSGQQIEDEILLNECLGRLTAEERQIYEESLQGRTLESIGADLRYSATTIGIKLKAIIMKLWECRNL
jgi:RNA polymerase sigma factor (sigma-70 family)